MFGRATVARGVFVDFLAEAEDLGTARGIDRFRLELSDGRVWGSAALSSGSVKIGR